MSGGVYLDASAIVKLVVREPESRALARYLRELPERATSKVAQVEVSRAVGRLVEPVPPQVEAVFARLVLLELSDEIARRAALLRPRDLRSLDAIHLASALELAGELEAFVSYDERLSEAARVAGLPVVSPA